jgi:hypothetical protein
MAVQKLQFRKRTSGSPGGPASLKSAEPAYSMVDNVLYIGFGDDGSGNATSVVAIAGPGAYLTLSGAQTVSGVKTFSAAPKIPNAAANDEPMAKGQADTLLAAKAPLVSPTFTGTPAAPTAAGGTNTTQIATTAFVQAALASSSGDVDGPAGATDDSFALFDGATGKLLKSVTAVGIAKITGLQAALDLKAALASPTFTGTPTVPTAAPGTNTTQAASTAFVTAGLAGKANSSHAHAVADVTGLQAALDLKAALASPALTGTPTAPTAATSTNSTQIATTAFVQAVVAALAGAAPGLLDTLDELAAALGDDPNFATTITTAVNARLAKASNLSDLTDASAARGNLGLGSMATQGAGAVNITGGTIGAGVDIQATIDGGTF